MTETENNGDQLMRLLGIDIQRQLVGKKVACSANLVLIYLLSYSLMIGNLDLSNRI